MAGTKSVWGIDIGQCALKAVKLGYDKAEDKAVLEAFDIVEHPKILSQPDAEPEELIREALNQFLSKYDVDEDLVLLSIPGQQGLARVVKLPPVEAKKVNDIVRFEATQQIPFKLADVAWDYQVLGSGEETEGFLVDAEVGIFAVKKEVAARHMGPLERKGIEVAGVQLAPVGLYNFAAFDQFLHASQKIQTDADGTEGAEAAAPPPEEEGDSVVILDIGADNTDLVVTNGDSIWLRNLPIGGNHFTRALAKELKLTFAKAEHLKRNATKSKDPKALYAAMKPVFAEFANELQRSVGFFQSTHRDRTIRKLVGVGNGFKLPGLPKFLQQHLGYPVEKVAGFHGLKGDALAEPTFQENLPSFCVAYGLALQGLKQTPLQTNLLPTEIRTKRMIRDKKPWTLTAAALLLTGFVGKFFGNYQAYSAVHKTEWDGPKGEAERVVTDIKKKGTDYDTAKKDFAAARDGSFKSLGLDAAKSRMDWIAALRLINECLPPRGKPAEKEDVAALRELNIDFVHSGYVADLNAGWFAAVLVGPDGENAKKSMEEVDQKAPPGGPGWVFQIRGHTYFAEAPDFLRDTLLKKLRDARMRELGFSHACVFKGEKERDWKPSKEPKAAGWAPLSTMLKVAAPAAASGGSSSPPDGSSGGLGSSGGMSEMQQRMGQGSSYNMEGRSSSDGSPGEMMMRGRGGRSGGSGGDMSSMGLDESLGLLPDQIAMGMSQKVEEKAIPRYDFDIQVAWSPAKLAEHNAKKEADRAAAEAKAEEMRKQAETEAAEKAALEKAAKGKDKAAEPPAKAPDAGK